MKRTALLIVLAGSLCIGFETLWMGSGDSTATMRAWWIGFLLLLPAGLTILIWAKLRWAAMACVIYGTVGLALDLATTIQILTKDLDLLAPLLSSLVSGLVNFLLVVFGGRSFLDVAPALSPQESRPPNPQSLV
jgi:hypothetical protein